MPRHGCCGLKIFEFPSFLYGHEEHDEHEEQNLQNGFGDLEFGSREEQIRSIFKLLMKALICLCNFCQGLN